MRNIIHILLTTVICMAATTGGYAEPRGASGDSGEKKKEHKRKENTKESYDEFKGQKLQQTKPKALTGMSFGDQAQMQLTAAKVTTDSGAVSYFLEVVYFGFSNGWLFIESGESLHILIDGERFHLSGEGSIQSREILSDGIMNVQEKAVYKCEPELIKKMAAAKEVKVKLEQSRGAIERRFDDKNFGPYHEFVAKYMSAVADSDKK